VNVRTVFEANAKTTETIEPRMSPFDDPTELAGAAAVFGAAPGDDWSDAALAKSAAMRVGIVATVGVDDLGLAKRSSAKFGRLLDFTRLASGISSTLAPTKKFSGNYDTFDQVPWANGHHEPLTLFDRVPPDNPYLALHKHALRNDAGKQNTKLSSTE